MLFAEPECHIKHGKNVTLLSGGMQSYFLNTELVHLSGYALLSRHHYCRGIISET
jgi:hypothetical protein